MIPVARTSALHALDRAAALMPHITGAGLARASLAPGMFDAAEQLRITAGFAMRSVLPPLGMAVPEWADDIDPQEAISRARHAIDSADGTPVRCVVHRAGFADLTQTTEVYIAQFALPNLWFHLSMAYAILRANGVDVGKADFDGLHAYPDGFSWV